MFKNALILFLVIFLFFSCSKKNKEEVLTKPSQEELVAEIYKEGIENLKKGDSYYASKKFREAESLLPQSEWAAKSALMTGYALYSVNFYSDSIFNLERYIKNYPADRNIPYAHYLIAMCYFEQILDEKKDMKPLIMAKEKFEFISSNFPETDYAIDAKFKMDLIQDQLAAKEMYVARYYMKTEKWIPAINRFKKVVEDYEDTIFVEEALHRLVEIYYRIGLTTEAKKIAAILGYNYKSSQWYKRSYIVFNKDYKELKFEKDKEDSLIKSVIKKLF